MPNTSSRRTAIMLAASALACSSAASAASFTGTRANVNPVGPPPPMNRCTPLNIVNIAPGALSSTGTSNFGAFASTQSHCIAGPPNAANLVRPITDGIFTYDFGAGDTFFGTYSGTATFDTITSIITGVENLIVLDGTGRFANATGAFTATGTLAFGPNPSGPGNVGIFNGTFRGDINTPVPEPATWLTMIVGFGAVGSAMRRRRTTTALSAG